MIFLSSLYRRLKLGLGGAGSICGMIGVIGGSMSGGVLFIVVGGVALAVSAMLVVDTMSAYSAIKKDVDRLTKSVQEHADHIENMRDSNEDYSLLLEQDKIMLEQERKFNDKLKSTVEDLSTENSSLHEEIQRLGQLYTKSKQLIGSMVSLDSSLGNTQQSFATTHDEYENTLHRMDRLINNLKNKTFNELDTDGNGQISKKEFERYITK
jgi:gas vesicle protein